MAASAMFCRKTSISASGISRKAHDCGDEPNICSASQPISTPRATALLTPPEVETCAPIFTTDTFPVI